MNDLVDYLFLADVAQESEVADNIVSGCRVHSIPLVGCGVEGHHHKTVLGELVNQLVAAE